MIGKQTTCPSLQLQNEFAGDVISVAEKSYVEFYSELSSHFSFPLTLISSAFEKVESDPTEANLRLFLLAMRENQNTLATLEHYLSSQKQPETKHFPLLQLSFRENMDANLRQLALKRDENTSDILKRRSDLNALQNQFTDMELSID